MIEPFRKTFTKNSIGKRGQVTLFIIAGVAIVLIAVLVVFFTREDVQIGRRITTAQVEPIKEYIEGCVKEKLENIVENLKNNGGRPSMDKNDAIFSNYNVLVSSAGDNYLITGQPPPEFISQSIEYFLINDGCSLDLFRDDFDIEEDEAGIDAGTIIGDRIVSVTITYPVKISKGGLTSEINRFSVNLEDNFGKMYNLAREIVTGVITGQIEDLAIYCGSQSEDVICLVVDNHKGRRLVIIGNREDFPAEEGQLGDS